MDTNYIAAFGADDLIDLIDDELATLGEQLEREDVLVRAEVPVLTDAEGEHVFAYVSERDQARAQQWTEVHEADLQRMNNEIALMDALVAALDTISNSAENIEAEAAAEAIS